MSGVLGGSIFPGDQGYITVLRETEGRRGPPRPAIGLNTISWQISVIFLQAKS